jgi:hypothetical protein
MEELATKHYVSLMGEPVHHDFPLDLEALHLQRLDTAATADLELPFSEDEIWVVVRLLPPDKAPRPDGFSLRLFQSCWTTFGDAVMHTISCFDSADGAVDVGDFRPVSLVYT